MAVKEPVEHYCDDEYVMQVFYCNKCNPPIYMKVKFNRVMPDLCVAVICPFCGRRHERTIKSGLIVNDRSGMAEDIIVLKSACSTENPLEGMDGAGTVGWGDATEVPEKVPRSASMIQHFKERWLERADREGGKL